MCSVQHIIDICVCYQLILNNSVTVPRKMSKTGVGIDPNYFSLKWFFSNAQSCFTRFINSTSLIAHNDALTLLVPVRFPHLRNETYLKGSFGLISRFQTESLSFHWHSTAWHVGILLKQRNKAVSVSEYICRQLPTELAIYMTFTSPTS